MHGAAPRIGGILPPHAAIMTMASGVRRPIYGNRTAHDAA